jgi:hypothetical protein
MRRIGRTSLYAALALVAALALTVTAAASPGEGRACATLRFRLEVGEAIAQPFDRWLAELADMAALTIDSAVWDEGEAMALRLAMNGNEAWTLTLLSQQEGVSLESGLMAQGAVWLRETDAVEARKVMSGLRGAIEDCPARALTAKEVAGMARDAAATLKRWGAAAVGTQGETCTAISEFLGAFAEIAEQSGGLPWLWVSAEPVEGDDPIVAGSGLVEAPRELPGVLVMEAFRATMHAVAAE